MRFYDTGRLLPIATSPYVRGTSPSTFKATYDESAWDDNAMIELGFAFNGAGPLYMAGALYAADRITSGAVETMIQPQIAPLLNGGISAGSFKYTIDGVDLEEFYGTYYQGWRQAGKLGTVVTNPVGGHSFPRYNKVHKAKFLWAQRAARFKGAWAAYAGDHPTRLKLTICGYYAGLSDVSGAHKWKIDQGNAKDSGLAYSRMSGFRTKWIRAPKRPYQVAKKIWKRAMRMLRAYTGFVVQSAGSSDYYNSVHFLANGCWEQVEMSDFYPKGLEFEHHIAAAKFKLAGQGAALFHMAELMQMSKYSSRLTEESLGWNGFHTECLDNLYKIATQPFTSMNGTDNTGTVTQEIPYVDLSADDSIGLLAKVRDLVGGYRAVRVKVTDPFGMKNGERTVVSNIEGDVTFNDGCIEAAHPDTTAVVFENIFAVNCGMNKPEDIDLLTLNTSEAPAARDTLDARLLSETIPSVETFPNSEESDDGLLSQISSVRVSLASDGMSLAINTDDGRTEVLPFMPIATLLVEERDACLAEHNAVATGNYGYGFMTFDPFAKDEGLYIINTHPSLSAYGAQERWHVPYKRLVALAWEKSIGSLPTNSFSTNGTAPASEYIYKAISDVITDNRYTGYDMQVRPPTFLPLFMCAEVCHKNGATPFARALAVGLAECLSITQKDDVISFGAPIPDWVTDEDAFYESIVTLLLLGGFRFTSFERVSGASSEVVVNDEDVLKGSPSDDFWIQLAEVSGLDSMSDLVTNYGVTEGIVNIPAKVLTAAAIRDPIGFGASMGVKVVQVGSGYMIGSRTYGSREELVAELAQIATRVVATDNSNVRNIATSLNMPEVEEIPANPKRYAQPFNWLMLIPHAVTAVATVGAKVSERYGKGG